jgi:CPA2 family monovalent cation:H+ antiporter-2
LIVTPVMPVMEPVEIEGRVIIVGFGLAGRCVADLLDQAQLTYTIIDRNPVTVETQRALGREIIVGDAADADTLVKAGLNSASMLALTIPDERAVLETVSLVRRLRPKIYIIARTNYSSQGMKASQLGADDVIKAEQAVALQFYEKLSSRIRKPVAEQA